LNSSTVTAQPNTPDTMVPKSISFTFLLIFTLGGISQGQDDLMRARRSTKESKDSLIFKSERFPEQKSSQIQPKKKIESLNKTSIASTNPPQHSVIKSSNTSSEFKTPPKYRLKPGDKIEVSVWGEDMTRELVVGPDGRISYILVGELNVLNMSFQELKAKLEKALDPFLIDPNVSIIGLSYEGNHVSILGAIKFPGRVVISGSDRLIDVLAKAGGLRFEEFGNNQGEIANLQNAYLSRNGKMVPVNFPRLLYEGDMTQNVPVQIGDFIYIPSSVGQPIYVTGEVNNPTSLPFRGQPTLLDAVAEAGGFNTQGQKNRIFLVRGGMVNPDIVKFNFYDIVKGKTNNPMLSPGDIIYVPPTTITRIERLSTQIIPFLNAITQSRAAKNSVQDW